MIEPRGPFTLLSAARFIAGWPPTRRPAAPEDGEASVRLGFLVDDWSDQAGVILRQTRAHEPVSGTIVAGTRAGADRIRDQAARIVSLDHDGTGYGELGRDDTVVGRLQEASGWLRPVLFHSPYEAACWAVISSRIRQAVAARVRDELSAEHGGRISVEGEELLTFPPPERLLEARAVRGLSEEKLRRLHGIAAAALAGQLDRDRLLEASPEEALAGLRRLPGIGPFWSEGILLRAVGTTDALALGEREGRRRAGEHYGLPEVVDDDAAFVALAERWRPFRTWVSVLLRAAG
ncbi:MAG: DNA-3-methyladenine glycosylase 2 family protein [Actinobacteria bacterium]|nr:DNA-3-methyladenine glycosylase 2 family protein [Actinomycetota bacterium]